MRLFTIFSAALALFGALPAAAAEESALAPARIQVPGAVIEVSFAPGKLDLPQSAILKWIENAANSVAAYYGRFPLARARIRVFPEEGERGIFRGSTYGYNGGFTRISIGRRTRQQELDQDWMMTHELIHLAFPDVPEEHHWIEEGISTYVEPIARAQAGLLPAAKVWADMVRYMPQGEPGPSDRGLDNTHTWGRTYWGGALFCMAADVRIRECSGNRKGLQDALRAIVSKGGNITSEWAVEKAFKVGDRATGCTALTELYGEMKNAPVKVDLNSLWTRLGIQARGHAVTFQDDAPLAPIREAITAPRNR